MPKSPPETALARFEAATAISDSEIPELYNPSRMSTGSVVKYSGTQHIIRSNGTEDKRRSRFQRQLRKQELDATGPWYVIDFKDELSTGTVRADRDAVIRVLFAGRIHLVDYKPQDQMRGGALLGALAGGLSGGLVGAFVGGFVGYALDPGDSTKGVEALKRQAAEKGDSERFGVKITRFRKIGEKVFEIKGRPIACSEYEIQSIRKTEMLRLDQSQSRYPYAEESLTKLLVSDEIPFGLTKAEINRTVYLDEHQKPVQFIISYEVEDYESGAK
jgi:hypothetical protein